MLVVLGRYVRTKKPEVANYSGRHDDRAAGLPLGWLGAVEFFQHKLDVAQYWLSHVCICGRGGRFLSGT